MGLEVAVNKFKLVTNLTILLFIHREYSFESLVKEPNYATFIAGKPAVSTEEGGIEDGQRETEEIGNSTSTERCRRSTERINFSLPRTSISTPSRPLSGPDITRIRLNGVGFT